MKNLMLLLSICLVMSSCVGVVFEEPQPKGELNLKEFPNELIGKYAYILLKDKETVEIGENYISGKDGKMYLSDSVILRKMGEDYVVNKLESKEGPTQGKWSIFVLSSKGCGMVKATTFVINDDKKVTALKEKYDGEQVGDSNSKILIINPSRDQFKDLLKEEDMLMSAILEKLE